ncbi:MAG: UTP--glucose-1-phosphate uridylyltransferase [Lachnospiraceae bacterium]|jgi:UDP-N-acetylglucosamine/UDP-N-acetylgalactosamine diphosphorylase|nr:UTP--glucose-1-phosphate uridylyltransferase [Lachnospiraceae bacterium]
MGYLAAYDKLLKHGQTHLLRYYDELHEAEQEQLLKQIDGTDFSVLSSIGNEVSKKRGVISPLKAMESREVYAQLEEFAAIGIDAIRKGRVALVMLAGGMGTRLGSAHPKGMYDIGINRSVYIFARLVENILEVVELTGVFPPLYIMTSEKNHTATTTFWEEQDYFGYDKEQVTFFTQDMAPASDYEGKVYLESKGVISTSPNGNAGWYSSMIKWGLTAAAKAKGIEWFNIFAVDNVLQRIGDPAFIGATIYANTDAGAKVVKKNARDEKVGIICLEDGRPSIVEYYDMTDELMDAVDDKGKPAYNYGVILNYLFRMESLDAIMARKLPLHVVEKKIDYLDANGVTVKPDAPNGYKFERLVLDMIHEMDSCLPFEVYREWEFAPIKNLTGVDSVESARELCLACGIDL